MVLNLDFNSDKSIYVQIKEEITKAIASGELKINESLPSVRGMVEIIGVKLHTAKKSYTE
ncbi:GntR family transcriptional regulator [Clostridioides difficile]|uniref:GntR family transcriptional regulator n=1 Tax=Clostridioides difficile TaxID=1496 RepID=UPI0029C1089A|nr:GntR family transcriptional regulator [Clostridioides difficile]MDX5633662.1 GntR family transcriptional regulator [Clostridioides difficile]